MQRPAKPCTPVRFRPQPPFVPSTSHACLCRICRRSSGPGGEIGRRKGLKIPRPHGRAGSTPAPGTNTGLLPAHDAWPPLVCGISQFRFQCDHINAAFMVIARHQSLYPLSPGQIVPMIAAFDVSFHEAAGRNLDRYREPAIPASCVDAVQSCPASQRQLPCLRLSSSPREQAWSAAVRNNRQSRLWVREPDPQVLAAYGVMDGTAHDVFRWSAGARRVSRPVQSHWACWND